MRLQCLMAATGVGLALAGCGGSSGDTLAVEISGGPQPRPLRIVVTNDGQGQCNAGPVEPLPSERLIEAREIEREIEPLAREAATFGGASGDDQLGAGERRTYVVRTADGTVRWREGARDLPDPLPRAARLGLLLDRQLCR